jgi:hypothetical protein
VGVALTRETQARASVHARRRRCGAAAWRPQRKREAEHSDSTTRLGGAAGHSGAERAAADDQRQPVEHVVPQVLDDRGADNVEPGRGRGFRRRRRGWALASATAADWRAHWRSRTRNPCKHTVSLRSQRPLSVVSRIEGSNPSPSAAPGRCFASGFRPVAHRCAIVSAFRRVGRAAQVRSPLTVRLSRWC